MVRRQMIDGGRHLVVEMVALVERYSPSSFNTTTDNPETRRNAPSLVMNREYRSWIIVAACSASRRSQVQTWRVSQRLLTTACMWSDAPYLWLMGRDFSIRWGRRSMSYSCPTFYFPFVLPRLMIFDEVAGQDAFYNFDFSVVVFRVGDFFCPGRQWLVGVGVPVKMSQLLYSRCADTGSETPPRR